MPNQDGIVFCKDDSSKILKLVLVRIFYAAGFMLGELKTFFYQEGHRSFVLRISLRLNILIFIKSLFQLFKNIFLHIKKFKTRLKNSLNVINIFLFTVTGMNPLTGMNLHELVGACWPV